MKVQNVDITKIVPYDKNPRNNQDAIEKVEASIKEFGFRQPIVVDAEMVIIAGHTRYEAAKRLELKKVPVHIATNLSSEQVKAYRIADNRLAQDATWDEELLKIELGDLEALGFDLELTGFTEEEIKGLSLPEEKEDAETTPIDHDYVARYEVSIECKDETEQEEIYQEFTSKGYKCRILSM